MLSEMFGKVWISIKCMCWKFAHIGAIVGQFSDNASVFTVRLSPQLYFCKPRDMRPLKCKRAITGGCFCGANRKGALRVVGAAIIFYAAFGLPIVPLIEPASKTCGRDVANNEVIAIYNWSPRKF